MVERYGGRDDWEVTAADGHGEEGHSPHGRQRLGEIDGPAAARGRARLEILRGRRLPLGRQRGEDAKRYPFGRRRQTAVAGDPPRLDSRLPHAWRIGRPSLLRGAAAVPDSTVYSRKYT